MWATVATPTTTEAEPLARIRGPAGQLPKPGASARCGTPGRGRQTAARLAIALSAILSGPAVGWQDAQRSDRPSAADDTRPANEAPVAEQLTGDEFDLDAELEALIAELNPPPLEEILEWFEPFPTVEEALRPLPDEPSASYRRALLPPDRERVEALEAQVAALCEAGQFVDAIPLAEELLRTRQHGQGEDHWETSDALRSLRLLERMARLPGGAQQELGISYEFEQRVRELKRRKQSRQALPLQYQALAIRKALLGTSNTLVARSFQNFAVLLAVTGDQQAAEALFRGSLHLRAQLLGHQHPDVALTLGDLGTTLGQHGMFSVAVDCHAKEAVLARHAVGNEHPRVDGALYGLARSLKSQGDYVGAEVACNAVLEARRARYGHDSPAIVGSLNELGLVLMRQGKYSEAAAQFRQACEIMEQDPDGGPRLATTLANLGHALRNAGWLEEARRVCLRSLAIRRTLFGDEHEQVGHALFILALVVDSMGHTERAAQLEQRALALFRDSFGSKHRRVASSLHSLSSMLLALGRAETAERVCREALAIRRELLGDTHEIVAMTLYALAGIVHAQGDVVEATSLARQAQEICSQHPNGDPAFHMAVMTRLGTYLAETGDSSHMPEAEHLLSRAVKIAERGQNRGAHLAYAAWADFLHHKRNQPGDALAWYQEAVAQIEAKRGQAGVDELDRARYFSVLNQSGAYGGLLRAQLARQISARAESDTDPPPVPGWAYTTFERGRGRALLDLFGRGGLNEYTAAKKLASRTNDAGLRADIEAIHQCEIRARARRVSADAQIKSTREDNSLSAKQKEQRINGLIEQRNEAQDAERQAIRELASLIRRQDDRGGLTPMTAQQVASRLQPHELLLAYDVGESDTVVLMVDADATVRAMALTWHDGAEVSRDSLGAVVAGILDRQTQGHAPRGALAPGQLARAPPESARALVPDDWRKDVAAAKRVIMIPDGPLHQLPFEMLVVDPEKDQRWIDAWPPIVYGPSGTVIMTKRKWAQERRERDEAEYATALVALGDPIFMRQTAADRTEPVTPVPDHGVLLAKVMPDSNAHNSGLRDGDVLLTYDGTRLAGPSELRPTIQKAQVRRPGDTQPQSKDERASQAPTRGEDSEVGQEGPTSAPAARVPVTIWRDGRTLELTLAPGSMGVRPSQASMPVALHDHRELQLSEDERFVKYASATTRDGFGTLRPLPGTRVEVRAIGQLVRESGAKVESIAVLSGEAATLTNLFEAAQKPRFLHLATHGLAEGGRKVYESSLALTLPNEPTPEDFGFLRLQDLLYKWGGKLEGTELVVLSGCRTARGRLEAADGFVGLTWGFLFAGADSVIASLWKVDDAATALLMHRLYENLLGVYEEPRMGFDAGTPVPKAEALHEAKRWLRHQTPEQNRRMLAKLGMDVEQLQKHYRTERGRLPTGDPQTLPDPFDYSHPRYWAAFVLIGSPD